MRKEQSKKEAQGPLSAQRSVRLLRAGSDADVRRGIYREDDWKAEVEILEDRSDDKKEEFTLRVIRTINESRIYVPTPDGEVFTFFKLKGYAMSGLGDLEILSA